MNEAQTRIFLTSCDQAVTLTLAQLRVVVAHVTPVAQNLQEGSEHRGYLDTSLSHLHQLHSYLLDQLRRISEMSAQIGDKGEQETAFCLGEKAVPGTEDIGNKIH